MGVVSCGLPPWTPKGRASKRAECWLSRPPSSGRTSGRTPMPCAACSLCKAGKWCPLVQRGMFLSCFGTSFSVCCCCLVTRKWVRRFLTYQGDLEHALVADTPISVGCAGLLCPIQRLWPPFKLRVQTPSSHYTTRGHLTQLLPPPPPLPKPLSAHPSRTFCRAFSF
jgi:hypothetical protein